MAFEEANLETNPGNGATYLELDKVVIYHQSGDGSLIDSLTEKSRYQSGNRLLIDISICSTSILNYWMFSREKMHGTVYFIV